MFSGRCTLAGLAIGGLTASSFGARSEVFFELVGQWGGSSYAVETVGDTAYVGIGPRVVVLDISTPAEPVFLGQSPVLPELVMGIAVQGDYVYVAASYGGFHVLDVSDSANIEWVGEYGIAGQCWNVGVSGDYAYVAEYEGFVHVFDVSTPDEPVQARVYPTSHHCLDVCVSGECVYALTWVSVDIFDASQAPDLTLVGVCDQDGWALDVQDTTAYIADSHALYIVDVSDPNSPADIGEWVPSFDTSLWCVAVSGSRAYLGDTWDSLHIIDVFDPEDPYWVGTQETESRANAVAVSGGLALVSEPCMVEFVDVADPENPEIIGAYDDASFAYKITAAGGRVLLGGCGGARIIDMSVPEAPTCAGIHPRGTGQHDVVDDLAFIGRTNGLDVVNVADAYAPVLVGEAEFEGPSREVAYGSGHAFIAGHVDGIRVVDVRDPNAPETIATFDTGNAFEAKLCGDYLYVADANNGLVVLDVSEPGAPEWVTTRETPYLPTSVEISEGFAYVGTRGGVEIYDVSDPASPTWISRYPRGPWVDDMTILGDYLYIVHGLEAIDISDPHEPRSVGIYVSVFYAEGVDADGEYVYAANSATGLWILKPRRVGDVDGDFDVDLDDLAALLASYGQCEGDVDYNPDADFDDSGCTDLSDLAALLANYGLGT